MPENPNLKAQPRVIHPGDIVQITDPNHHWFPALIVASEIRSWGCQGFCFVVKNDAKAGEAYIRLKTGQFEYCGTCIMIGQDMDRDRRNSIAEHAALQAEQAR